MSTTPRLAMTQLASGQAAPETAVNENDLVLEFFGNACHFKSRANNPAEPGSPAEGDCYLLTGTPTGSHWAGKGGKIALFYNGAWAFKTAREGFLAWVDDEDIVVAFDGTNWNSVSSASEASNAQMWAGTDTGSRVTPRRIASAAAPQTLTDAATVAWDMALGFNAKVTLGGNRTLTVANPILGWTYSLNVIQDATGTRTLTWPASFDWGTTGAPVLTTTASKRDRITLFCTDAATPKFDAFLSGKGFS